MKHELQDLTTKELWELFPIIHTPHQDIWENWYKEEQQILRSLLPDEKIKFHHVGSTAIKGIYAKPIIDFLIEVPKDYSIDEIRDILVDHNYICMYEEGNRKIFNKGYNNEGYDERVFHYHLRFYGDHDELYFRDYLNDHPEIAQKYEKLKLELGKKYKHDRDQYTEEKGDFVKSVTKKAKQIYTEYD